MRCNFASVWLSDAYKTEPSIEFTTQEVYRPVSVLPIVAKIMEKIVHRQLYSYLQEHSILNTAQSGFRPQHTTQNVLMSSVDDWRKALDDDKLVGSVMVDLSKAFDSVSHSILWQKLESYGVRAGELQWFRDYLNERRQRVSMGKVMSAWSDIRRGVPQGSILGPLLFMIFNDLPDAVEVSRVKQYADDTTIYHTSDSPEGLVEGLSKDLAGVDSWIQKNRLQFNVMKTQMLLLSRKRRTAELEDVEVALRGEVIPRSKRVKYLGV